MADPLMEARRRVERFIERELPFNWDNARCAQCGSENNPVIVDYPHPVLYGHKFVKRNEDRATELALASLISRLMRAVGELK